MNTPLLKITYEFEGRLGSVFVKDESKNATGSIKIRPASNIVRKSYELGLLKKGQTVIEVTSGNMGIALAEALKPYGNKLVIYMPSFMSKERQNKLREAGAELILTKDFKEAFALAEQRENVFYVRQFENRFNAESYSALVDEVRPLLDSIPAFIAGVGTGGTINGVGNILKAEYGAKIIAVDPAESKLLTTGHSNGKHQIEGLSDGFIPALYPESIVDQIIPIASLDAVRMAQKINDELGVGVGISSGAYFLGAVLSGIDKAFTLFPDCVDRYYSTKLSDKSITSPLADKVKLISIEKIA